MKALPFMLAVIAMAGGGSAHGEARRSGTGPEVLPARQKGPSADLPDDGALAELRKQNGAMKVQRFQPKGYSLAELSQFIGEGDRSVILPKGAVIHCPEAMATRILAKPRGRVVTWAEFLVAHRSWIATREVTLAQVRGEAPLPEAERASLATTGKMVIATFRGIPVTVLPPPPSVERP